MARFTFDTLKTTVHNALRAWHSVGDTAAPLLNDLLLVQQELARLGDADNPAMQRRATNQVLLEAIKILAEQDSTAARVLSLRFPDNNTLAMTANQLNVSEHTVSRMQRTAIGQLTQVLYDQEMALRDVRVEEIEARLPPSSYSQLFGTAAAQAELKEKLLTAQSPWVVAAVGLGGIGKTALADAVARDLIRDFVFDDVIWLRVEPQTMTGRFESPQKMVEAVFANLAQHLLPRQATLSPQQRRVQVHRALKLHPHLVVIDNLEGETAHLLAHLNDLADPTKFLLTSRERPSEQGHVFNYSLDELTPDDAAALICYHAEETGIATAEAFNPEDLQQIYAVTGGNPLALKLVVSLLDTLPLPQVYAALSHGRNTEVEKVYKHIYRQTWQILSTEARTLLESMPVVAESGATPDYLQKISGLPESKVWSAVYELRRRSLLEVRGTIHERRYGIHRLTDTFLRTEIIDWDEE